MKTFLTRDALTHTTNTVPPFRGVGKSVTFSSTFQENIQYEIIAGDNR